MMKAAVGYSGFFYACNKVTNSFSFFHNQVRIYKKRHCALLQEGVLHFLIELPPHDSKPYKKSHIHNREERYIETDL